MSENLISKRIFAKWEKEGRSERPRAYLGASSIGHECEMLLWLVFRGAVRESFDGRTYRLFDRGNREEPVFCDDLRRIGCEVRDRDKPTGQQFSVSAFGGHFAGHLDAIARGLDDSDNEWHVCEFKTHSDSSFRKLCKVGVREAKPMHYAQMQAYMGLTGLCSALYMAVDKDNDDLWCETIRFDKTAYDKIIDRAKRIIDTCDPIRCANRPDDFRCKACHARSVCWHESGNIVDPSVPLTCRTCCHATAVTSGEGAMWECRLGHACGVDMTCESHLILPVFVDAEIAEGTESSIAYDKDGKKFTIGIGGLSCKEAQKISIAEVDAVSSVKEAVADAAVSCSNNLEMKYSKKECTVEYNGNVLGLREWCSRHGYMTDWSKPSMKETICGKKFFEYDNSILVEINGNNAKVMIEKIPF